MSFAKYLPTENVTYLTQLTEVEVKERLAYFVQPQRSWREKLAGVKATKPYEGTISDNTFSISRVPAYRNSFLPDIDGAIHKTEQGVVVDVKLRLKSAVMVFMAYWLGAVGLTCLLVIAALFFSAKKAEPVMVLPFVMLLFGYLLMMGGYKYESNIARNGLQKMFEAKII
jgi:hypothetical protein